MKRFTFFLLGILFLSSLFAQNNERSYNFPIKPGSTKWNSFRSVQEMYEACQIPVDTIKNLSTKSLLLSCLNYPAAGVLMIHNTPQQGFDDWKSKFNGVKELFARSDVKEIILNTYANYNLKVFDTFSNDYQKGEFTFRFRTLEILASQEEIINSLSSTQAKKLLKIALLNFQILENNEGFGFNCFESTGRLIFKCLIGVEDDLLKSKLSNKDAQYFLKSGMLIDKSLLFEVVNGAKKKYSNG